MLFPQIFSWLLPEYHLPESPSLDRNWPSLRPLPLHKLITRFIFLIAFTTKRYCLCFPLECKSSSPFGSITPLQPTWSYLAQGCTRRLRSFPSLSFPSIRKADTSYSAAALSSPWRPKNLTDPARHKRVDTALDSALLYTQGQER